MLSKNRTTKILLGIIALAIIARLTVSTSPAIAVIGRAFPHASATQVESIATIGDLAAVISALTFGKLLDRWTFKSIAIISVTTLATGGLLPLIWHQSVYQLLLAGFIAGLGAGGITTILPSLQSYIYDGEKLANMLGRVVALENGSSMVLLFFGGILANQYWLHNYYLFFIALISLVIIIFTIPHRRPDQKATSDTTNTKATVMTKHNISSIIAYLFTASMMVFLEAVLYNKNAIYIQHFNLGSPALSGRIIMLDGAASIVVGLSLPWIRRILKQYILAACFGLTAIGGCLLLFWHTTWSIALATFIIGASSATMLTTVPYILSTLATARRYPLVMGFFSAITSLGFSSSALIFNTVVPLFSKQLLQGSYQLLIILALVMCVILLLTSAHSQMTKISKN